MKGAIRVVRASASERELVLTLVDRLLHELEDRPEEFAGIDRDRVLRHLERAGDRWNAFLARVPDGRTVGVATVMETFAIYAGGDHGVIDEMYVAPEHRSRGVGRLIIDAIKEYGRSRGWLRIDVTAPPEERWRRSMKFYESQGFVFTGPKLRFRL